jgi:hypothetical protein
MEERKAPYDHLDESDRVIPQGFPLYVTSADRESRKEFGEAARCMLVPVVGWVACRNSHTVGEGENRRAYICSELAPVSPGLSSVGMCESSAFDIGHAQAYGATPDEAVARATERVRRWWEQEDADGALDVLDALTGSK